MNFPALLYECLKNEELSFYEEFKSFKYNIIFNQNNNKLYI